MKRGVTFVGAAAEQADAFPVGIQGVIGAQGLQHPVRADAFSIPASHILTLRPDGQYDFESGSSVAAAELTGVIALLMSTTGNRLSTAEIVSLLRETGAKDGATAAGSINVDAALAKLDIDQHRGRVASRSTP